MRAAPMGQGHAVSRNASRSPSAIWSWLPPAPATSRSGDSRLWLRICWRLALTAVLAGFALVGSKLLQALR